MKAVISYVTNNLLLQGQLNLQKRTNLHISYMKDTFFSVGHIGALSTADYDKLIAAFKDLNNKHFL